MMNRTFTLVALTIIGAAGCSGSEASEHATPEPAATNELQAPPESIVPHCAVVLPGNAPLFGKSITRWSEAWWHWISTVPMPNNPDVVLDTACSVDQDGPLFFVPTYLGSRSYVRVCDVPLGKPVLVPVQVVLNEYPCPDPSFHPAPGQSLEDFLRQGAVEVNDLYRNHLFATVDAQSIDLTNHRHTTDLFINTVDPSLLPHIPDPCLTGTPQPVVSDGWWMVLFLAPGNHDVRVTGTNPDGTAFDRDYQLHVRWD